MQVLQPPFSVSFTDFPSNPFTSLSRVFISHSSPLSWNASLLLCSFLLTVVEQFCFLNCFERGAASLCSPLPTGDVCPQLRFLGPSVLPCLVWFLYPALFVVALEVFASWPGAFAGNFRDTWGLRQPCCLLPTSRPRVFWEPAQCAPHWGLWCFHADCGLCGNTAFLSFVLKMLAVGFSFGSVIDSVSFNGGFYENLKCIQPPSMLLPAE